MPSDSSPRLTPLGLVVSSLAAVTVAAGLILLAGPVLVAGVAAVVFLLACRHLASRHLEGFSVKRELPRRARARESFPMVLHLTPGTRFPLDSALHFTDPLAPAVRARPFDLSTPAGRTLRCTGLAHRRGPLALRPWTITSTWPLGLFETERQGSFLDDHSLLVLPKPWLPARLRERLEHLSIESAQRPLQPADPVAEFRLLREFRNGDPVRGIHWPASLRSGRLQYAETEPPRPKPLRYGILLHSLEPPGTMLTPETYEFILRITTGLLLRFQREEIPVLFCQAPAELSLLEGRVPFAAMIDRLALSRHRPISSMVETPDADLFHGCDEVFILSDCPLVHWEATVRARFAQCTCLDTSTLTTGSRPGLLTRSRDNRSAAGLHLHAPNP